MRMKKRKRRFTRTKELGYFKETKDKHKPGLGLEFSMTTSRVTGSHTNEYEVTHFARSDLI